MDEPDHGQLWDTIRRNRELAEERARLAPEVGEAAGRAGLWSLTAPKECGGAELPLPTLLTWFERLGEADPTVGWHAVNSIPTGLVSARLGERERAAVLARLDRPFGYAGALAAGVAMVPDDGGFRLRGTWPFMTGAADASWATATVMVTDADGRPAAPRDVRRIVFPLADAEVGETWQAASGMRGTGSHAVAVTDLYVPETMAVPLDAPPLLDRPLFNINDAVLFFAPCAAMAVGILRSATAAVIELVGGKISRFDGHAHFDDPRIQQYVADAVAAAECLSAGLERVCGRYWDRQVEAASPEPERRARLWSVVFASFDVARYHVSNLYAVGTSSAYATRNPIERALRDVHALNAAFDSFQSLRRAAGRSLLGHEPNHPRF
ncbi:MAG: acyl-CoA dehydrogenase family protein [Acidimicrobiia bacterium]